VKTTRRSCPAADIEVRRISESEWRVGDGRVDEQSPDKILGFIQRSGSAFEVMAMDSPRRDVAFESWEAAVHSFASPEVEVHRGALRNAAAHSWRA
jgi:hypothetical protein